MVSWCRGPRLSRPFTCERSRPAVRHAITHLARDRRVRDADRDSGELQPQGQAPDVSLRERPSASGRRGCGLPRNDPLVFTIEQRDRLQAYVLQLAAVDDRVVAGALVGSLVEGGVASRTWISRSPSPTVPRAYVLTDSTQPWWTSAAGITWSIWRRTDRLSCFVFAEGLHSTCRSPPHASLAPPGRAFRTFFGNTLPVNLSPSRRPPGRSSSRRRRSLRRCSDGRRPRTRRPRFHRAPTCLAGGHYIGAVRDHASRWRACVSKHPLFMRVASMTSRARFSATASETRTSRASTPRRCALPSSRQSGRCFWKPGDAPVGAAPAIAARMPAFD